MFVKFRSLLILLIITLMALGCAKKGRPSGGPKDEQPPLMVTAKPPYETTFFKESEIRIEFNEFITLKDLTKQLIVSPPLKNNPVITPQGTPSKYINIKLLDTLLKDKTYIIDFGNSVQDNNEGNQLERFKYVFSTGDYIDSLKVKGSVKDAFMSETQKNIKLVLFKADSSYNDSLIYKRKPDYVSSTLDTTLFEFSNLAPGKFHLFALEDNASDYLFSPKEDKIGFYPKLITIPNDSILQEPIVLFKETLPYQFSRAKEVKKGKLMISFKGKAKNLKVTPISSISSDFKSISKFEKGKDTLNYWFHNYDKDSIILLIENQKVKDTAIVKLRKEKLDSLSISNDLRTILEFNDTVLFNHNNPIVKIDASKVRLIDKDTISVKFEPFISSTENKFGFLFEKKFSEDYKLEVLPNAIRDLYGFTNDTIRVGFKTKKLEDYGDIILNISNPENKNLLVQLVTEKDVLVAEQQVSTSRKATFKYLNSQILKVRIIHDKNKNGKWDTGGFLAKKQAESVYYHQKKFEIRPNWSLNETVTINSNF